MDGTNIQAHWCDVRGSWQISSNGEIILDLATTYVKNSDKEVANFMNGLRIFETETIKKAKQAGFDQSNKQAQNQIAQLTTQIQVLEEMNLRLSSQLEHEIEKGTD